ncbi:sigma-70 family RNA polymerase sigma factor [Singulisphaera sp. PoT]|uniref:sigma-70 family RNA polymerase sigma factor n=1 Tax=Singulisphaera sp. PoT TaxID=3411797 RepID=UPI003BF601E2
MASEDRGAVLGRIRQVFVSGTTSGLSEEELLGRFVSEGDELAFEALVQRHGGMVWGVCRRLLPDPNDAEDAFQATFLVMVRKAGMLRDPSRLGPWLYGVAVRTASRARANALRRKDREVRAMRSEAVVDLDRSSLAELRWAIDEEILRLPMRFRQPVLLCHMQEKTVDEAARELGLTPAAVRGRLFQARRRLRLGLERRGLEPSRRSTLLLAMTRTYPLPGHLVEKTASFALGASGTAAVLARQVASTMLWGQLKGLGIVVGALVVVAAVGVLGGGFGSPPAEPNQKGADPTPDPAPAPAAVLTPKAIEEPDAPDDTEVLSKLDPYKARAGRTSLEVVDAETGRPVQAQMVRSFDNGRRSLIRTDSVGHLDLEHGTNRTDRSVSIDLWADGYALQRFSYRADGMFETIPEKIVARLRKGYRLAGRFVNQAGEPVGGVTVYLWSHNYKQNDPHELFFDLQATSGPDGRWETTSAPEITGELIGIRYYHPDYISEFSYGSAPPIAKLRDGTAETILKKGVPLSGTVLGGDGAPVEGAIVMLGSRSEIFLDDILHTRTDEQGRFRFASVNPGRQSVVFRAPNFAPQVLEKEIQAGIEPIEVRMQPGKSFHGRVVDSEGRPINKAQFYFQRWKGLTAFSEPFETDSEGRFRWDHAPEGVLIYSLYREGYTVPPILPSLEVTGDAIEFRMARSLTVYGQLTSGETGKPVRHAIMEFGGADAQGNVASWETRLGYEPERDGRFIMTFDSETAKGFRFRVRAPGFEPFVSEVIPGNRSKARLDIKLKKDPLPGPSGVVLSPDGKPRAGARVLMAFKKDSLSIDCNPTTRPGCIFVETGPDGRYQLPTTDEPYALAVVDPAGFARYNSDEAKGLAEIRLQDWCRIEGKLPNGPLRNQETLDWVEDTRNEVIAPPPKLLDAAGRQVDGNVITIPPVKIGFYVHRAVVDDRGSFVFDRVPPVPMIVSHQVGNVNIRHQPIAPQPGETVRLDWDDQKKAEPR